MQSNILEKIAARKRQTLRQNKRKCSLRNLKERCLNLSPRRDFMGALSSGKLSLIAEIKKASPSAGIINNKLDVASTAKRYEKAGASAISVVTEEHFFCGSPDFVKIVRRSSMLPILAKDFVIDEYQIYELADAGADAILLLAALLPKEKLKDFFLIAGSLNVSCLVEVHGKGELKNAIYSGARIIGINNRNLKTFKVDLNTTKRLVPLIPQDRLVVSESGFTSREAVSYVSSLGVGAVLVGEALCRSEDIEGKVRELISDFDCYAKPRAG